MANVKDEFDKERRDLKRKGELLMAYEKVENATVNQKFAIKINGAGNDAVIPACDSTSAAAEQIAFDVFGGVVRAALEEYRVRLRKELGWTA